MYAQAQKIEIFERKHSLSVRSPWAKVKLRNARSSTYTFCKSRSADTLLTAERIWFKCDLYLRFIPPINIWNIWIDLRPFLKCKEGPFLRSWRSPRSNNLEIQNDENSKSKLVKTRWNPKFGLSDLENDLLTSTTSEVAEWIFSKITFFKSVHQAEKNEL